MSSHVPGLVHLDVLACVRHEVAAVADDDRVGVELLAQLAVDAGRLDRRRCRPRAAAPPPPPRRPRPHAARRPSRRGRRDRRRDSASPRSTAAMSPTTVGTSTWPATRDAASTTCATRASPKRPKPTRKSSGVPITTTRSARSLSSPRVRRNASGCDDGQHAAPETVEEARHAERLGCGRQLVPRAVPVGVAAHEERRSLRPGDHRRQLTRPHRHRAPCRARRPPSGTSPADGPNRSSGKSRNTGPRCGLGGQADTPSCTVGAGGRRVDHGGGELRDRRQHGDVVELLQRAGAPAQRRGPPAEHDQRRAVEQRRRHRRDAVRDTRPRRERGDAPAAG